MVDALDQASDSGSREAALVHFVERVGADEADALRRALAELEVAKHARRPVALRARGLRETGSVSALAFTLLAVLLVGPVPALLGAGDVAAARAPRRDRAVAGDRPGRGAFGVQRGHRHRQPALRPGRRRAAHRQPRSRDRSARLAAVACSTSRVFALTLLIGARLVVAVVRVAIATRRRRAHHRMLVDLLGCRTTRPVRPAPAAATCASSTSRSRWPTACPACAAASWSARAR